MPCMARRQAIGRRTKTSNPMTIHRKKYPRKFKQQYLKKLHQKHIDEVCKMLDRPDPIDWTNLGYVTGITSSYYPVYYTSSMYPITWPIPDPTPKKIKNRWVPPSGRIRKDKYLESKNT